MSFKTNRRVVVTGIGCVTPLGLDVKTSWNNLIQCHSGIKKITSFNTDNLTCKIAATIPKEFDINNFISPQEARRMDRFIHLGIVAAQEAIQDSNWQPKTQEEFDYTGVLAGSGIGGLSMIESTSVDFCIKQKRISPFFIPASLINLLSGHISIKYGYSGPNSAVVNACSTGTNALGDAFRMIQYGDANVMIAGGAESAISSTGMGGFCALKALTTNYNDTPEIASRPWDQDRSGFVMGEGAGILVLEEYEHAKNRGAKIYAELLGYGVSSDAYHITAPHTEGRGAKRAILNAMKDANISTDNIDYINAHGTSTPLGDAIELQVIEDLFLEHKNKLFVSSTKSSIGHLLGAAGSVESIFSILAMRDNIVPPTLNLDNPIKTDISLVEHKPIKADINCVMNNSFGFGGTNASVIFANTN